jgi:hypothetical protein
MQGSVNYLNFKYLIIILGTYFFLVPFAALAQPKTTPKSVKPAEQGPPSTAEEYEKQYQERIKQEKINGVYIPKNLDDAMLQLDKLISPDAQAKVRAVPEDSACMRLHHRMGQWIILNWGFYGGSRLSHYLRSAGVSYPDDMADFLIIAYHRHLNKKPYSIKELATKFKEKRKAEFEKEKKERKVIKEEVRKKPKEDKGQ